MKSKGLLYLIMVIIAFPLASWVLSPGGSPGGKTGSPGDGGATCTQCHTGASQPATGWITSTIPASGYVPGQTYTVTATASHSGAQLYGFEVTSEDGLNAKKGTFVVTNATQTKILSGGKSITHTASGTTPSGGSKTWAFDWTAPAGGTGTVSFYGAFNAANGNGSTSGDVIYLSTLQVDEISTGITSNVATSVGLNTYPNPFTDYLEVSMKSVQNLKELRLVSTNGAIVYSSDMAISGRVRLETADYPAGAYQFVAIFEDGSKASRLVIKK